jgi:hypothetical protein
MQDREDLDLQLDAALASYADPEQNSHLAAQILTAIAPARPVVPPRRGRQRAVGIPAFAALLLAAFFPLRHFPTHRHAESTATASAPKIANEIASRTVPTQPNQVAASRPLQKAAKARRARIQLQVDETCLPKREVFPTPTPLTPQEQALAALVNRNPGDISQSIAKTEQQQPIEPLRIAAIHIPPLNLPENGEN